MERVRLGTETITEQKEVTEAVRKEHIELDDAIITTDDSTPVSSRSGKTRK